MRAIVVAQQTNDGVASDDFYFLLFKEQLSPDLMFDIGPQRVTET